jgi:hypothetical protein
VKQNTFRGSIGPDLRVGTSSELIRAASDNVCRYEARVGCAVHIHFTKVKRPGRFSLPPRRAVRASPLRFYGSSIFDAWRLAGIYAGRILKGESAGNFWAQQSAKSELVINMRTAKALDWVASSALVSRADHVI